MTTTLTPSRTVRVAIACPSQVVQEFIHSPEHLPTWASDLRPATARAMLSQLRVRPLGGGAEVTCTLVPWDGTPDDRFRADAVRVERDLQTLKRLLEAEED